MEAIDNKYLIVVKKDGVIDAIKKDEITLKDKRMILELIAKGFTVIINKNNSEFFLPNTFSSFEQASISLELFNYYSQDERNCFNFFDVETGILKYSLKEEAREKLEEEKSRLEERHEIECISKKALILIYSDGKAESILEYSGLDADDNFLLYYLTELYNRSNRLRKTLPNFIPYTKDMINVGHNQIDYELVKKKVAIFLNQDIGRKKSLRTNGLSFFHTLLPKNYGSIVQIEKLEEIIKKYPEYRMQLSMWNDEMKMCTSTYLTDVLEDMVIKKELIRKEGK